MIRLAVIGVGWAGQRQIQAATELDGKVEIKALLDSDRNQLREIANNLRIDKTYTQLERLLADPDIDAVSVCTPHALHASMAIAAAEAGKHVIVEKPMALTVEDATEMIAAAEANGVKLYVAENWVYSPLAGFMRDVVRSGRYIGELTAAAYNWGFQAQNYGFPGRRAWLAEPESGGTGTWMLHGIHSVARLRHILGEVAVVYLREHHNTKVQARRCRRHRQRTVHTGKRDQLVDSAFLRTQAWWPTCGLDTAR